MLRALLRLHRTELRNRLRARGGAAAAVLGAGAAVLLLGGAVWFAGREIVASGPTDPNAVADSLFDRAFWLSTLVAFVMGYTTFELLFRSPEGRRLESLPVPGWTLFADRLISLALWHLPLLLLALLYHAPLLDVAPRLFGYAAVVHGASWTLTLAVGTWLHVLAGRSLLAGTSTIKEFLGSGFHTGDAALVLYSPGGAFAVAAFGVVPIGLLARPLALWGRTGSTLVALGIVAVVCAFALVHAGALYARSWRFIRARFTEAEVLRPWREHDLPQRVFGDVVERWLAPPLRGLYRKDLVQLRRRHRIDLTVLWAAVGGFALFHVSTDLRGAPLLWFDAGLLLLAIGAALTPVYRLAGRELEPEGFLRALPVPLPAVRRAKALVALTHQLPLVCAAALAWLVTTGEPLGFVALLVGGGLASYGLSALFLRLSIAPRRSGAWVAWAFRGAIAAAALLATNLATSVATSLG